MLQDAILGDTLEVFLLEERISSSFSIKRLCYGYDGKYSALLCILFLTAQSSPYRPEKIYSSRR